jgi:16S rRNA (cytosine1402-N4)-methyltransferase
LAVGGRLAVISFHSLEERIVKEFIKTHSTTEHWPRELPLTHAAMTAGLRLKRINGPIRPGEREQAQNIRARSATLRIMEKIK